jgi:methanol--5-hydroxybenzimidazolylcobamide Co-methyltransferase
VVQRVVEYHAEFGGSSVQCWLGVIGYEAALMNTAKTLKQDKVLRDLYMSSDRYRAPERSHRLRQRLQDR